ncbi:hypothetical protein AMTR_s00017p00238910 [Amborella trichopoda]|uniref:Uncharacterized protein n=1 Tax=Amborella trichopoda TaxID=13333 RepID=W1PNJ6_AMBTC|nr:hypothetical protein AMTR_s00017p00238910 [Amborella trichopoda]
MCRNMLHTDEAFIDDINRHPQCRAAPLASPAGGNQTSRTHEIHQLRRLTVWIFLSLKEVHKPAVKSLYDRNLFGSSSAASLKLEVRSLRDLNLFGLSSGYYLPL